MRALISVRLPLHNMFSLTIPFVWDKFIPKVSISLSLCPLDVYNFCMFLYKPRSLNPPSFCLPY
uniref:Uncharacterized protein n=1 Tax=Rhizophora mucronata TaxID=61149 RepID=A0A2P2P5H3_RHIMU